jgi:hypothetical protein
MDLRFAVCKPFSGIAICCEENHPDILTSELLSKLANASLCSTRFQFSVTLFVANQPVADYGLGIDAYRTASASDFHQCLCNLLPQSEVWGGNLLGAVRMANTTTSVVASVHVNPPRTYTVQYYLDHKQPGSYVNLHLPQNIISLLPSQVVAMSTRGQFNTKNPTIKRICKLSRLIQLPLHEPDRI